MARGPSRDSVKVSGENTEHRAVRRGGPGGLLAAAVWGRGSSAWGLAHPQTLEDRPSPSASGPRGTGHVKRIQSNGITRKSATRSRSHSWEVARMTSRARPLVSEVSLPLSLHVLDRGPRTPDGPGRYILGVCTQGYFSPLSVNCLDPWPGKADVAHHILPGGSGRAGGLRAPSPGSKGRGCSLCTCSGGQPVASLQE